MMLNTKLFGIEVIRNVDAGGDLDVSSDLRICMEIVFFSPGLRIITDFRTGFLTSAPKNPIFASLYQFW